jgi:serine/threonine protein kinase/formylglycine-generating enzyme required for sulfatase activity
MPADRSDPKGEPVPNAETGTLAEPPAVEMGEESSVPLSLPSAVLPKELAASQNLADVRELGRGGMGIVYLARNTVMHRLEVLKIVNRSELDAGGSTERFLREIRSAAKLKHPNVVAAHSAQQLGDLLVFVMEYVPGDDLAKVLAARGPLPVANACYYAYQAALGLQHAHEKGMVHRDIKPSNLILAREGKKQTVKILDFGLAKGVGEKGPDPTLTRQGAALGTPAYMSPEQIRDAATADIRSDVYSLGCTLFHFLTGRPPFAATSLYALFEAHEKDVAPRLDRVRTDVPPELADAVAKMLAKSPADRYQTPGEVAAALKPYFVKGTVSKVPPTTVASPRPTDGSETAVDWSGSVTHTDRPSRRTSRSLVVGLALLGTVALGLSLAWAAGALRGKPAAPTADSGNAGTASPGPRSGDIPSTGSVDPKPGEERSFEIAPGVKMVFCWIPPGTATLGSPAGEPARHEEEAEHAYTSKGFWLGKYEVTQEQWKAVTGDNPSHFDGVKENKANGMETARFPVESVSWNDCRDFLTAVNGRPGVTTAFGRPGRFVLPHEDEWEFACRGGKGNAQAFYFGRELTGDQANCNGNSPYVFDGNTKGPYLERPAAVGSYESKFPHPWGLCDMHGNVWEWCDNWSGAEQLTRVLRGGAWLYAAPGCRAAAREGNDPEARIFHSGLRVCFRPD